MATHSQGITATWGGTAFTEVVDLSWTYGGGLPKGRSAVWTDDLGSVTLTCLGAANVSTGEYGQRKQIAISGGGVTLTQYAVLESLGVAAELNGVTRYTVTLKLLDS